jgi:hypothetical protein
MMESGAELDMPTSRTVAERIAEIDRAAGYGVAGSRAVESYLVSLDDPWNGARGALEGASVLRGDL